MRKNNYLDEYMSLVSLLELRPTDIVLDARSEPDVLLPILHQHVTERGRVVGLCFGQETIQQVKALVEKQGLERVEIFPSLPIKTPFKDQLFHGAILRHIQGLPDMERVLQELWRVTRPSGRIVVRHLRWEVELPGADEEEREILESLKPVCCSDGTDFFRRFQGFKYKAWREVRMDVFTIASNEPKSYSRYEYDWRTVMRDQLFRDRRFDQKDIVNLIHKIEDTELARVEVERYLALGIKP